MEARIVRRLGEVLQGADLSTATEKSIRRQLEAEMGESLSQHKQLIRAEIQGYLEAQAEKLSQEMGKGEAERGGKGASHSVGKGGGYGSILSPEMSAFFGGVSHMARTELVKKIWEYIKAHNLQDPSNRRNIILDDKLRTIFKPPLDMFKMNKQLSRHCKTDDTKYVSRKPSGTANRKIDKTKPKAKAPKAAKAKKAKGGEAKEGKGEGKRRGGGGFGTVTLVGPLRDFVGKESAPRTEVIKKIWDHIKTNNCKDPNDGRNIIPDGTLKTFLTAPVNMFNINKQLKEFMVKQPKQAAA